MNHRGDKAFVWGAFFLPVCWFRLSRGNGARDHRAVGKKVAADWKVLEKDPFLLCLLTVPVSRDPVAMLCRPENRAGNMIWRLCHPIKMFYYLSFLSRLCNWIPTFSIFMGEKKEGDGSVYLIKF